MTPLVLVHGIGGDIWDPWPDSLPQARRWSLPGYSGTPLGPEGFPAWADALASTLPPGRVDLLGHSIGGMLAQEFALRHPDRLRGLILYATTPAFGGRDPAFAETFLRERLAPLDAGQTMAEFAAEAMPGMLMADAPAGAADIAVRAMAAVPEAAYRAAMRTITTFDRKDDLPRISAPTLLLAAEHDTLAPVKTMTRMRDAIPGARLEVLAGAGHLAHLDRPAEFAAAVARFIGSLPA